MSRHFSSFLVENRHIVTIPDEVRTTPGMAAPVGRSAAPRAPRHVRQCCDLLRFVVFCCGLAASGSCRPLVPRSAWSAKVSKRSASAQQNHRAGTHMSRARRSPCREVHVLYVFSGTCPERRAPKRRTAIRRKPQLHFTMFKSRAGRTAPAAIPGNILHTASRCQEQITNNASSGCHRSRARRESEATSPVPRRRLRVEKSKLSANPELPFVRLYRTLWHE